MKRTSLLSVGFLALITCVLPSRHAVAQDYAIQAVIDGVAALTPIDNGSPADFFAVMDVGGVPYRSDIVFDRDRIAPAWSHYAVYSRNDLLAGGPVGIAIGLRDTDDRFGESSREVDINALGGVADLHYALRLDPRGGAVILYDADTGRPVRQLQPLPGGNRWTTGRMLSAGREGIRARVAIEINVVRLPRYRY